jgi:putative heme-binding domain-containing protein
MAISLGRSAWIAAMTIFVATWLVQPGGYSQGADGSAAYGIAARVPWTTSSVYGRPEPPPPYRPLRLYSKLRFVQTTLLVAAPGGQLFVGERAGKIYSLPADRHAEQADLFLDTAALVDRLTAESGQALGFESLYGLAFDPDFANNRYCYVCYVVRSRERGAGRYERGTRVSRFRVSQTDPPVADPESEQLILSWLQGGHNGGCLKFGPDGYLYISTGDGGEAFPPDGLAAGQDLTTLLAKILRIDVRRQQDGRPYAIPSDNPFADLAAARGETWAYGLRNPWRMSFDRQTGDLWVGDVGWELWEMVYRVNKGDNFGWSIVEGRQTVHAERPRGPTPIVPPSAEIPHTEGASVTGGYVYRGTRLRELAGTYIFGDWETRRVWGMKVDGQSLSNRYELIDPVVRIVDFAEDDQGELYLLDHDDGSIFTLEPNPDRGQTSKFPTRLSETGLFESVADHQPAPGVLAFSVNVEQWSDHATAERLIAVPQSETIRIYPKPRPIPGSQFSRAVDWPTDTVLVKTLSLEMIAGDPASARRIETQMLHYDGREWQGYTYEWNDQQTDATLVDRLGKNRPLEIADPQAHGGRRQQTWRFSSRNECLRCHNPWSEYALAFNVRQLNHDHDYGGVVDNQIRTLKHIGILDDGFEPNPKRPDEKPPAPRSPETLPRLTPPFDATADLNERARSYLHVNCGHCHRFNGGGSSYIFLTHDLTLEKMKAVGVRPAQGTFGIPDPELIAAGDPYRSVLYFRLAKSGPGHMPHLGARIADPRALTLIRDWIRRLPREEGRAAKTDPLAAIVDLRKEATADERRKRIEEWLSAPPTALMLADAVREERLPLATRQVAIERATQSTTDPAIRDLFEGFLPEHERTERLGDTIDVAQILNRQGDVARGRQLFHESTVVQCRSCHRIGSQGTALGPDLDAIGKKYDRAKLLTSILQPSLEIEPKYTMYLVETKSGLVHTGLLVDRNDKRIVLRDAQNKEHVVSVDDVAGIFPQTRSFMPDMQLRDFTAEQAADLLAYLTSLKPAEASESAKASGQ